MKYLSIIFLLALASCQSEVIEKKQTTISGMITNSSDLEFVIQNLDYEKTLSIAPDGSFLDTLEIGEDAYVTVVCGRNRKEFFLLAETDNEISFDAEVLAETFSLKLGATEENALLEEIALARKNTYGSPAELYAMQESDYLKKISDLKEAKLGLIAGSKANESFKQQETRNAEHVFQDGLTNFEGAHQYYTKKPDFKASAELNSLKTTADLTNENEYKNSSIYRTRVLDELINKTEENVDDSESFEVELLNQVSQLENGLIKSEVLHEFTYIFFSPSESLDETYALLKENTVSEKYLEEYAESYLDFKKLARGQSSPDFVDYENHSGGVTSLSDLKGKYVYVDVWATWCGPCKAEIPSLQALEEEYHGNNIEFVSASVDNLDDHDKWKDFVSERGMKGIQLMADKSWESDFVQGYQIGGIPRFILIDPEGNIVSADAPRPSNPGLVELFSELNI